MSLDYGLTKNLYDSESLEFTRTPQAMNQNECLDLSEAHSLSNLHDISQQLRKISTNHRLHAEHVRDISRRMR